MKTYSTDFHRINKSLLILHKLSVLYVTFNYFCAHAHPSNYSRLQEGYRANNMYLLICVISICSRWNSKSNFIHLIVQRNSFTLKGSMPVTYWLCRTNSYPIHSKTTRERGGKEAHSQTHSFHSHKEEVQGCSSFNAIMEGQRICTRGTASNTHTLPCYYKILDSL